MILYDFPAVAARRHPAHAPSARLSRPPRPHDPGDRIPVASVTVGGERSVFNDWEVRIFDPAGPFHCYLNAYGILPIQLWHVVRRVPARAVCVECRVLRSLSGARLDVREP